MQENRESQDCEDQLDNQDVTGSTGDEETEDVSVLMAIQERMEEMGTTEEMELLVTEVQLASPDVMDYLETRALLEHLADKEKWERWVDVDIQVCLDLRGRGEIKERLETQERSDLVHQVSRANLVM